MLSTLHDRESLAARRLFVVVMALVLAVRVVVPVTATAADGSVTLCLGTERLVLSPDGGGETDPPRVEPCPNFTLAADAALPAPLPSAPLHALAGTLGPGEAQAMPRTEAPSAYRPRAPPQGV
jgi:hypothetical protein